MLVRCSRAFRLLSFFYHSAILWNSLLSTFKKYRTTSISSWLWKIIAPLSSSSQLTMYSYRKSPQNTNNLSFLSLSLYLSLSLSFSLFLSLSLPFSLSLSVSLSLVTSHSGFFEKCDSKHIIIFPSVLSLAKPPGASTTLGCPQLFNNSSLSKRLKIARLYARCCWHSLRHCSGNCAYAHSNSNSLQNTSCRKRLTRKRRAKAGIPSCVG